MYLPMSLQNPTRMSCLRRLDYETGDDLRGVGEKRHHPEPLGITGLDMRWLDLNWGVLKEVVYKYTIRIGIYRDNDGIPLIGIPLMERVAINTTYQYIYIYTTYSKWSSKNRDYDHVVADPMLT